MKKTNFFAQKRLTYFAKETPGEIMSSARTEATNRVRGIEDDLKSGKNVEQATEAAKFFVREAGRNATAKLEADWELRKEKEKYMDYLKQVKELVETTIIKIAENKERYDRLAKFVAKKTEIEAMLEKNRVFFEGNVKGRHDLNNIAVLNQIADSLALTHSEIERMPLDDPKMEEAKSTLNVSISEQIAEFEKEVEATREHHNKQLTTVAEDLAAAYKSLGFVKAEDAVWIDKVPAEKVNVLDDEGKLIGVEKPADGRTKRFTDAEARAAWQNVIYVKSMLNVLAGLPDEKELQDAAANAAARVDEIVPVLEYWDKNHYQNSGPDQDKKNKAWKELPALEANLARAKEKYDAVQKKKNASYAEKQAATQWLTGAEQNVNNRLALIRDSIYNQQAEQGDINYKAPPPTAVATRWGTTEVEHMGREKRVEEPVTPEPEYVAMPEMGVTAEPPETAPPRIASAESDKKKSGKKV